MKQDETIKGLSSQIPIPTHQSYALQCVDEKFEEYKSSGSMGITRKWQIIAPEIVKVGDTELDVTGTEVVQRMVTKNSDGKGGFDEYKTKKSMARVWEDYKLLGFEGDDIDEANPVLIAKGKVVDATLNNEEYVRTYAPTPEQLAQGKKQGDPILDDDGKPRKGYKRNLGSILGSSKVSPRPF